MKVILNITLQGVSGDYTVDFDGEPRDWDVKRTAVELVRSGSLPGLHVGCHVSHLSPTGASLYFTVLAARDREDPAAQWERAKRTASDALVAGGATITHHHAAGRDHMPWLADEHGRLGVELLRALKERCDPAGIMNPGVLAEPF